MKMGTGQEKVPLLEEPGKVWHGVRGLEASETGSSWSTLAGRQGWGTGAESCLSLSNGNPRAGLCWPDF